MRFKTTISGTEGTAAGIAVPAAIVEGMGKGKRPPVKVTIAGHTYRSTVAVMGGAFMVGVTNEFRNKSGVAAGDTVDVDIELDTEERTVTVPPELARALDRDPRATSASRLGFFIGRISVWAAERPTASSMRRGDITVGHHGVSICSMSRSIRGRSAGLS